MESKFGLLKDARPRPVLAVFALGIAVRLALLRYPQLWYDEATVGIMGRVVLRGEWPIYFHGQPFMGALDAYLAAPVYFFVGASARTLEGVAVLIGLVWYALLLRLAWEAFGPRAAFFAGLWLAVPPDYFLYWAHEGRPAYFVGMTLGTLALLLALRLPAPSARRTALGFALLGAVLGMAFWTNFLTLVYFPAVAAILLLRGFGPRKLPAALPALPTFVLGSLPHWLYGVWHGGALPPAGERIGPGELVANVEGFVRVAWPLLAGVPGSLRGNPAGIIIEGPIPLRLLSTGAALAVLLGLAYAAAIASGARLVGRPRSVAGSAMAGLLVLVLANLGVTVGTHYGAMLAEDGRYLVPLYTALPLLAGRWLAALDPRWATGLAAAWLAIHGADALSGSFRDLAPAVADTERATLQTQLDTIKALEGQGVTRLYAPDFGTRVLTYLSGERVIFSNHYEEIYPPYAVAVDGAERAAWWLTGGGRDPVFDTNLAALGVRFAYHPVLPLGGVYTDFAVVEPPLRELDPARFVATASLNQQAAGRMADRDIGSLWSTGRVRQGGEWVEVDLGQVEAIALIRWLPGTYQETPTGLRLELSSDGHAWQRMIELTPYIGPLYWSAGRPMDRVRSGRVELRIPPTPARYLRLTQLGANKVWAWTIRELFVYAAAGEGPAAAPSADGPTLARALRAAGVTRLYADHGWGARVALADPAIRILPANLALDAYGFPGSAEAFWPHVHWGPGAGALVEPFEAESFAATAGAAGLGFTRSAVGGLALFAYAPPPGPPLTTAVPPSAFTVTASRHPEQAARAVDGDTRTRWATGHPQTAGDWVRLDFTTPRVVRAVRLWTANPSDSPRRLVVEGSADGVGWSALAAHVQQTGALRWGGITLLRDGTDTTRVDFPPTRLRALRLVLTASDPVFDWSIHELAVYGAE